MIRLYLNTTKDEVINMTIDIGRALTQAIVVHLLSYAIDDRGELFNERILKKLLYITISMVLFNLVVRRYLIKNINKNNESKDKN